MNPLFHDIAGNVSGAPDAHQSQALVPPYSHSLKVVLKLHTRRNKKPTKQREEVSFKNLCPEFYVVGAVGITLGGARHEHEVVSDDRIQVLSLNNFPVADALLKESNNWTAATLGAVVVQGIKTL